MQWIAQIQIRKLLFHGGVEVKLGSIHHFGLHKVSYAAVVGGRIDEDLVVHLYGIKFGSAYKMSSLLFVY